MLQPGTILGGRFRVDRMLGAGGMGVVVAATHLELGQQVAIKVLHEELSTNPTIVARFLREARAVAQLRTEHVCRVFDVARLDSGAPFIVMEMLDGSDLTAVIARKPLPVSIAVEYVLQACVALAEAHAQGIVHRDLKPANLFVTRRADGGPLIKVLDFGIAKAATAAEAKLTHTTSTMGSPHYMSPEQIKSARDVDLRTDLWALGVTLYQLISGRLPFLGTQLAEIAVNITTVAPSPLDVDPAVRAIVMRCLEKEPELRFPDVAALAIALLPFGGPSAPRFVREITRGQMPVATVVPAPVPVTAPTAPSLIATPAATSSGGTQAAGPRRRPWIAIIAVVAMIGAAGAIGWLVRGSNAPTPVADAGASAPLAAVIDARVATVVDATVALTVDAAVDATVDAMVDAVVEVETADATTPKVESTMEMTRRAYAPYAKQTRDALRQAEGMLDMIKQQAPDSFEEMLTGYIQTACMVEDPKLAQRLYDRLSQAESKRQSSEACTQLGITLVDRKK